MRIVEVRQYHLHAVEERMGTMPFEVCAQKCDECLFSENKIVDNDRRRDIIQSCLENNTYFIYHKGTLAGRDVCCRGFFDAYSGDITLIRAARMFNQVKEVDVTTLQEKG